MIDCIRMNIPTKKIKLSAILPDELGGLRLDQALAKLFPEHSRSRLQLWIQDKKVHVDGQLLRGKDKVLPAQLIEVNAEAPIIHTVWEAQAITLDILYEDEQLIIVNKPAGLVVHPAAGNPDSTLLNALLHYAPELRDIPRAGIVHRLDKDTSGILVVARTLAAHTYLVAKIQAREVKREYLAVITGTLTAGGTVEAPIGRHHANRTHMAVTESGKIAITHYRVIEKFPAHTYIRVILETGRTHQIRVHMAHIGRPIVGDQTYGGRLKLPAKCSDELKDCLRTFKRQALHAYKLALIHPVTGVEMSWEAPIPEDFQHLLHVLKSQKK